VPTVVFDGRMSDDWIPLTELADEERRLQFRRFTVHQAWNLGVMLMEEARRIGAAVVVDISKGDQQLFHAAMPSTAADNDVWITRKVNVVRRFGHSSLYVGQKSRDDGTNLGEVFALPVERYAAYGGAFPIAVREVGVVGVVAVSGLAQVEDHRFAVHVLERYLQNEPE